MAHHLFIAAEKTLPMRDFDVALIRHLLLKGAARLGNDQLAAKISRWQFQGPGVWIGIDEKALSDEPRIFEAALEIVRGLGDSISADYLNADAALPDGVWHKGQRSADVAEKLRAMQHHLTNGA